MEIYTLKAHEIALVSGGWCKVLTPPLPKASVKKPQSIEAQTGDGKVIILPFIPI